MPDTSTKVRNNISRTYELPYPTLSSGSGPIIKIEKLYPTMYAIENRWIDLATFASIGLILSCIKMIKILAS
jgi:hypothetical protein